MRILLVSGGVGRRVSKSNGGKVSSLSLDLREEESEMTDDFQEGRP